MKTAELTLKNDSADTVVEVREGVPLFAGRSVECDIYLPSPAVSRRHAVFLTSKGKCGLKDLDSANGTYLNGQRIAKPVRLKDGDIIQIAGFIIEFKKTGGDESQTEAPAPEPIRETPATPEIAGGAPEPAAPPPAPIEPEPVEPEPIEEAAEAPVPEQAAAEPVPETEEEAESVPPEPDSIPESADDFAALLGDVIEPEAEPEPAAARPKIDADTVRRTRDSIRRTPKAPPAPKLAAIEEVDTGDGSGDTAFMEGEEAQEEGDPELALAKAAAEAGLVGEFNPEPDAAEPAQAAVSASAVPMLPDAAPAPDAREANPNAIPVDDDFRAAIESRLFLYSFMSDLKTERDMLLASKPSMADAVKSELARQDREMDKLPPPEKAEEMIEKRTRKRRELKQKVKEAKASGAPMPPLPSREMRQAEDIAINQWTLIAQSGRDALPAAYAAGYRMMDGELLADELEEAGIEAKDLLGGAAYLSALHELLEEAKYNRSVTKARLSTMQPPSEKKPAGGKKLLGFFGKGDDGEEDGEEEGEEAVPGETYEELVEMEAHLGKRAAWINQEAIATEQALIKRFWAVYTGVATHFLVNKLEIPLGVRAFLRYGAVGFNRWWMNEDVRRHVVEECTKNVLERMTVSGNRTNVVYADEYLAAVMNLECTPSLDENLEMNARNSPEWKADKALRKLIYSRSQQVLMGELMDRLSERVSKLEAKAGELDNRIKNLLPGSRNLKTIKAELSMERQAQRVEISKLSKLAEKIRTTTLAELRETVEETEQRFDSGELPRPTPQFLVERECEAVRKIGRLLANLKERFLPLVLRDSFQPDTDACNDRGSILGEIADIERRDPNIFLETLIPSKKRANRVDLRLSPTIVLLPSAGVLAFSWNPRQKPEDGRLAIPTCFIRPRLRERQLLYLMSDFRWDTSKASAGMDVMNSETIVAGFMSVRWDWRKRSREGREKGLIYTDQNDRTNWRRVYEAYMQTAYDGGKKLYNRNYDFYERIIGKYFDMPEGVELLRK